MDSPSQIDEVQPLLKNSVNEASSLTQQLKPLSLWWLLLEPFFIQFGFYTPPDPTYGRWTLPELPAERKLLDDPNLIVVRRRVFVDDGSGEEVELKEDELRTGKGRRGGWVFYQTWEKKGTKHVADLIIIHGYCDYGTKWLLHVSNFLSSGYRIIVPDLPAHGHSTGVHAHIKNHTQLRQTIDLVLTDLSRVDSFLQRDQVKRFLCGASLGGFTVLSYLIFNPPGHEGNHMIDGAFVFCPLVKVNSRPSWAVQHFVGTPLEFLAGRLDMLGPHRGNGHRDPRVSAEFLANPQTYHGRMRCATGLNFLRGIDQISALAHTITLPIAARHGSIDRVTSPAATSDFMSRVTSTEKSMIVLDGYEHVMFKVGVDEEDDRMRQEVIREWKQVLDGWVVRR